METKTPNPEHGGVEQTFSDLSICKVTRGMYQQI